MKIIRGAIAGTLESGDVLVTMEPCLDGLQISIESVVKKQFGQAIEDSVKDVLSAHGVEAAHVLLNDRGAVDCVIQARVEAAVLRASEVM